VVAAVVKMQDTLSAAVHVKHAAVKNHIVFAHINAPEPARHSSAVHDANVQHVKIKIAL
jgi:hypothetical protein